MCVGVYAVDLSDDNRKLLLCEFESFLFTQLKVPCKLRVVYRVKSLQYVCMSE